VNILLAGMIDGIRSGSPKTKGTSCWWSSSRAVRCLMTNHRNSLLSLIENHKTYDD
jgi:hypothetical protein